MKKILIILTVCLFSSSCSSQKNITDYIQNEIKTKKENNIKNLLIAEKANIKDKDRALIYKEVTIRGINKPICEIILFKKDKNNWIIDQEVKLLIKDMHE